MSQTPNGLRRGLPPAAPGIPVPADKRFRRSEVRQGRRRNWRRALVRGTWFGGAGIVVLALLGWLGSALADASFLRVNRVVVRGNTFVSTADVEARLQGLRGASLLRADLDQFQNRLLENPWVASAELWRVFPSTVDVRIVERVPLAVARLHGQLFLVDASGVIISRFGPQYGQFDLPIVDGLMVDTASGPAVNPDGLLLVERLFKDLSSRPDLFRRLSQVNVSDPHNAIVLMEGEPAELRLGDEKFVERLERWAAFAGPTRDQISVTEYWELRFDDHVIYAK